MSQKSEDFSHCLDDKIGRWSEQDCNKKKRSCNVILQNWREAKNIFKESVIGQKKYCHFHESKAKGFSHCPDDKNWKVKWKGL